MKNCSSKIDFLGTTLPIAKGKLNRTLYRKPTNGQQYLDYNSNQPQHSKHGIFTGQSRRIRRICSYDTDYFHLLSNLTAASDEKGNSCTTQLVRHTVTRVNYMGK